MSLLALGPLLLAAPAGFAWGQTPHSDMPPVAAVEGSYPSLNVHGFTDIDYAEGDAPGGTLGFHLGQFVLHFSSALAPKASFFGEVSATPGPNTFAFEVERSFVRYDYNDALKFSAGRFHTPIGYWNTAFHHGFWLQTTVLRPEMVKVGGTYVPVHFVGVKAEGDIPSGGLGLGYEAGVGNGRSEVLSRGGDAGDVNTNRAWLVALKAQPIALYGLTAGASVYRDWLSISTQPTIDEWIYSGHVAWTRETPELIGELIAVQHHDRGTGADFNNLAYYVQAACRLPGRAHTLKPYARFEKMDVAAGEPVFTFPDQQVVTAGIRFDALALVALKAEYRNELSTGSLRAEALLLQASYTF